MMWWGKKRTEKADRGVDAGLGSGGSMALMRSRRAVEEGQNVQQAHDVTPVEAPILVLASVNGQEVEQRPHAMTVDLVEPRVVNARGTSGAGRPQRGAGPKAPVSDVITPFASLPGARRRPESVETLDGLKLALPEWKGECLEGAVASDASRTLAVLWLGLGDVVLLGTREALGNAHAMTVRERLRTDFTLQLQGDMSAPAAVVTAVVESAAAAASRARAGKPSRDNYLLVIYDELIAAAVRARASDIHFSFKKQEHGNTAVIGLRMFGRYRPWRTDCSATLIRGLLGASFGQRLVGATNSKPDVHFANEIAFMTSNQVDGKKYQGRCNGRPSVRGYKLVIRLLESDPQVDSIPTVPELGYVPSHCSLLEFAVRRNYGVIIVFGSTGSGKSTTLRTFMVHVRNPDVAYSVESPAEYEIPGVEQYSIPVDPNMTSEEMSQKFLAVLRDVLRMDPDALMVGEIRDHESAVLMAEFTQSGHRCFTTAHGDSAVDGLSRLCGEQIRMPAELLGGARFLGASIYQRLLPKLCPNCRLPACGEHGLSAEKQDVLRKKFQLDPGTMHVARPGGCEQCVPDVPGLDADGTKGVTVAAEVLIPDGPMRELAAARNWAGLTRVWRETRRAGFGDGDMTGKTAFECSLYLASQGIVSIADIEHEFEPLESYEIVPVSTDKRGAGL